MKPYQMRKKAREYGRKAFHVGVMSAPVCDKEFMEWIKSDKIEYKALIQVLKAWSEGWHTENLKAPLPEVV